MGVFVSLIAMSTAVPQFCAVKRKWQECEVIVAGELCREDGWGEEKRGEEGRLACKWAAKPCKPQLYWSCFFPPAHHCKFGKERAEHQRHWNWPVVGLETRKQKFDYFSSVILPSEVRNEQISFHHQKESQFISVFIQRWWKILKVCSQSSCCNRNKLAPNESLKVSVAPHHSVWQHLPIRAEHSVLGVSARAGVPRKWVCVFVCVTC